MILRNKKTIPVVKGVTDLREAEKLIPTHAPRAFATAYPMPPRPPWCYKQYRAGGIYYNPGTLTCTCQAWQALALLAPPEDLRRCCPHLTRFMQRRLAPQLGALCMLLLKTQQQFGPEELLQLGAANQPAVMGFTRGSVWVNVYTGLPPARFSYSPAKQRWSHGASPANAPLLAEAIRQKFPG